MHMPQLITGGQWGAEEEWKQEYLRHSVSLLQIPSSLEVIVAQETNTRITLMYAVTLYRDTGDYGHNREVWGRGSAMVSSKDIWFPRSNMYDTPHTPCENKHAHPPWYSTKNMQVPAKCQIQATYLESLSAWTNFGLNRFGRGHVAISMTPRYEVIGAQNNSTTYTNFILSETQAPDSHTHTCSTTPTLTQAPYKKCMR